MQKQSRDVEGFYRKQQTSFFLENYIENYPERVHGEIVFLQLQGMVTKPVIPRPALASQSWPGILESFPSQQRTICAEVLGGRLSWGGKAGCLLWPQPGSALHELRLGTESTSVLLHRPFLSRDRPEMSRACSGTALQGYAGRITITPHSYRRGAAAADRALFQWLCDSHVILSEKTGL